MPTGIGEPRSNVIADTLTYTLDIGYEVSPSSSTIPKLALYVAAVATLLPMFIIIMIMSSSSEHNINIIGQIKFNLDHNLTNHVKNDIIIMIN